MTIILYALFLKLRIVYDFSDTRKSKTIGTQNINVCCFDIRLRHSVSSDGFIIGCKTQFFLFFFRNTMNRR